jgi:hypothetical protein
MQRKPPEYNEVIYNAAFCLMRQATITKDRTKARQAEQLLKATMVLNPKLNGPDMVARYKVLLDRATSFQKGAVTTTAK